MTDPAISPTELRHAFSLAMSKIYQEEVPLYADLLRLVAAVNAAVLQAAPALRGQLQATQQLERLHYERHGAIRLGTPAEMALMARFFALLGMQPVGYYDLAQPPARLPIHATCFRCLDGASLLANPFRMFVSLLRPERLSSPALRAQAAALLARRALFSPRGLALIAAAERQGGVVRASQAAGLLHEGLQPFRWSGQATVSLEAYRALQAESPLLADIVGFPGPHINHLTPRTLDIDAVQRGMAAHHLPMKDAIEGPPARACPILLRQTSFKALEEKVYFPAGDDGDAADGPRVLGSHTARFGEIEQRGAALTAKGRALYDACVQHAWQAGVTAADEAAYRKSFAAFPDTWDALRAQQLVYFRYVPAEGAKPPKAAGTTMESLIQAGLVTYEPLTYEDFLPLSAAGIFQSNLKTTDAKDGGDQEPETGAGADEGKAALEAALGRPILNEFDTYSALEAESLEACRAYFGIEQGVV